MTIREAMDNDIDALVELNSQVQGIHVSLFPTFFHDTDATALAARFGGQLADPSINVYVANTNGDVVGYLVLLDVTRNPNLYSRARAFTYIDQICVAQGSRGQGVGRALIARAADRARELGRDRLELDVWSDNQRARSAFEALGFRTYTEKMKLELT